MPSSSISVEQPRRGCEPGEMECNSRPAAAAADADVGNQVKYSHSSSSSSSSLESAPACSIITVIWPGALDLNAPASDVANQTQAGERRPLICVPCGAAFYFSEYEFRVLCDPPPWYMFPPPPAAADIAFVTQAVVASMPAAGGAAAAPVPLLVCSNPDHFLLAVGALQPRELDDLEWKSPASLGVVPLDVRRDERAPVDRLCSSIPPAPMSQQPPPPPPRQVVPEVTGSSEMPPEHEAMVELTLRPPAGFSLNGPDPDTTLALGRR